MPDSERLDRAVAAIDAENGRDPQLASFGGVTGPKEIVHAKLVTEWVRRLTPEPSEALLLAARAHHIRRWEVPRSTQPPGRDGYLRWREDLHGFHARICAEVLAREGYGSDEIAAVTRLICKTDLRSDVDAQTLEDALCLVFLQTQAAEFADQQSAKAKRVLGQTLRKMSAAGRAAARELALREDVAAWIEESLSES